MALEHARAGEKVHLGPLGTALAGARTSAVMKTDRFELVRIVLKAGASIPLHAVDSYVSLQCLEGAVVLDAGESVRLRPDDWIYLDRREPHALRGLEDSSLLLTIYFD